MDLIRVKDVTHTYKTGVTALYDLNLSIEKGEFVFIIGSTGCGKSTLGKLLYRELKPTKGTILIGGENVGKLSNRKVYENVAFELEIFGLTKDEIHEKVLKALELVGLKSKVKMYPRELSGGEQQRVAIARAIVNGPKLLICDEPTGNLDPETSMEVMKVLESINELGTTVIMVTHDINIVDQMKKRTILLNAGRVLKDYPKGEYTK